MTASKCLILASFMVPCLGFSANTPLTDAEADAIVQAEAQTKAAHKADKPQFQIISQKIVEQKDGSQLIINRVKPPPQSYKKPKRERVIRSNHAYVYRDRESVEAVFGAVILPPKPQEALSLSVTIFDGPLTKLQWSHDGQVYTAWSSVDFNYLRSVASIETDETSYLLMMGIGEETDNSAVPQLPAFTADQAEYFVITDEDSELDPVAFDAIDALHTHYQENEEKLKAAYQRTEALNAARKRHEAANSETPKDTVINFWKIEP